MKYELERYELWARECTDEGVAAEHLGETCKEIRRLRDEVERLKQNLDEEISSYYHDFESHKKLEEENRKARDCVGSILNHLDEGEEYEARQVARNFLDKNES